MQSDPQVLCPVCGQMVTPKGKDRNGEPAMEWHARANWKKCEGSHRSLRAIDRQGNLKRPGVRGEQ